MRYFLLITAIVFAGVANAQAKLRYSAGLEAGLTKGNSDNSHAYLLTNGVVYKSLTAGIGAGIDDYVFRSLPLFADIKKTFGHRHLQPFINASVGININEAKDKLKSEYNYYPNVDYKNGFYARAMAGVSLPLYKRLRVFIDAGYSYKTTRISYPSYAYSTEQIETTNTDIYRFNRWVAAVGFWF